MANRLNAGNPIVFDNGTMQQQFRGVMSQLQKQLPINGSGPPNGVVEGELYQVYLDDDGSAGSIQYRKMFSSIGGDKKLGWVLV